MLSTHWIWICFLQKLWKMFHLEKAKPRKILTHNDRKSFSEAVFHDPLKMLCTNIVYYHVFRVILLKTLRKKFYYWSCTAYQKKKKVLGYHCKLVQDWIFLQMKMCDLHLIVLKYSFLPFKKKKNKMKRFLNSWLVKNFYVTISV